MKFFIALVLVIFVCVQAHNINSETVTVFNTDNFGSEFNFDKPTFFLLYAPWCGHCKRLMPVWNQLQEQIPHIRIAAVDCDKDKKFCGNFAENGRMGYPMLRFVGSDEKVYIYNGARDAASLTKFANGGYTSAKSVDFPNKLREQLTPKQKQEENSQEQQKQQKNVEL